MTSQEKIQQWLATVKLDRLTDMDIQSFSIVVPNKECINKCPFCVSRMVNSNIYPNLMDISHPHYDINVKEYLKLMIYVADCGCSTLADIAKAFGCGVDFVMLGGMLAGCEEAAGKVIYINDKLHKEFYGMSSNLAQERHFGGRRPSSTSEGREKYIPVTGTLDEMLDDIEGSLKSACCYIGARELKNFPKCCTFYKVNNQLNMKFTECKDISK